LINFDYGLFTEITGDNINQLAIAKSCNKGIFIQSKPISLGVIVGEDVVGVWKAKSDSNAPPKICIFSIVVSGRVPNDCSVGRCQLEGVIKGWFNVFFKPDIDIDFHFALIAYSAVITVQLPLKVHTLNLLTGPFAVVHLTRFITYIVHLSKKQKKERRLASAENKHVFVCTRNMQ
jgi:hypothetical protein